MKTGSLFAFIVIFTIFATYGTSSKIGHRSSSTISGGVWFSIEPYNIDALGYNYNITQETNSFTVGDSIQFLISVRELNFIYYSWYNSTSKRNEIFRARPDGSNIQYITTSNSLLNDPHGRKGVVKFGIDIENGYLYYTYDTILYQSLLTGVNSVVFADYSPYVPTSVTYNPLQKTLGVIISSSSSTTYNVTLYQNNNDSTWTNSSTIISASIADFSVYDGAFAYTYGNTLRFTGLGSSNIEISTSSSNAPLDYNWNNGALYYVNYTQICAVNVTSASSYNYLVYTYTEYTSPPVYLSVEESTCPNDCECNGECVVESGSSKGTCECTNYYYSPDCSVYCVCPNGHCNSEGECVCNEGYYGSNCTVACSSALNCSNNGYCITVGYGAGCICDDGYLGYNCSIKELPPMQFSGGIISQPFGDFVTNSSVFNWNFTESSATFPFIDPNFVLIDPNSNFIYFSLYDEYHEYNQLFRAYPDGSEMQFIANITATPSSFEIVQKFSFDIDYQYLYFGYSDEIYRYSIKTNTVELFYSWVYHEFQIYSLTIDTTNNNIWFFTDDNYFQCITVEQVDCSTYHSYVYSITDFVVYNSTIVFLELSGSSKYLGWIDATGSYSKFLVPSSSISSCNCLTIDPTLLLVYYSYNQEILTLQLESDLNGFMYTNSSFYLPYSNGKSTGVSFLSYTPSICPMDCGAKGDCMITSSSSYGGECACYENYYSSDCSLFCSSSTNCSNNGECTDQGECECDVGYYSYNCGCTPETTCSGNGNCTSSGSCSCFEYSSGPTCTPIIPNPTVPSSFFCTSYFVNLNISVRIDMSISEVTQERRFDQFNVNGDIERSIIQKYIYGTQYNITYDPETCISEDLNSASFSSFIVPAGAKLTFFNGTVGACVQNAVEVWNTSDVQYTYVQVCATSAPSGFYSLPYQIYWIEKNNYLEFDMDSFQFSVPSSNYTLPTFC